MAGSAMGDGEEAVNLNVTPLIDIIFCLCIFFMCSFHFRQLEGKLDSWLPTTEGVHPNPIPHPQLEEVRIFFTRDPSGGTKVSFGARELGVLPASVAQSAERERILSTVAELIVTQRDEYANAGFTDVPVILDGEPFVPWKDVLAVLDRCKKKGIDKVQLAQAMPKDR